MDIKKQLPKIGKENKHGECDIGEHEFSKIFSIRPDYNKFKSKQYNRENDCVAVIIGFINPSTIYQIYDERQAQLIKEGKDSIFDQIEDQRWIDSSGINELLLEIKTLIEIGEATKEIGTTLANEYPDGRPDSFKNALFPWDRYHHSLSFLNWMKKNSYPIPDELMFRENRQGQLEYVDPVVYGHIEKTFPRHPSGKEIKEDPLYVAVKVRQALMDGEIIKNKYTARTEQIKLWIKERYPFVGAQKRKEIMALANDGKSRKVK